MAVTWGLLSTARINRQLLAAARASDRVEFVAVASRDRARAEEYALQNGLERAYGSYDELLADPDIAAVYIGLPNSMHVEWSLRALEAGKHVLCEKPFTRRPEDAERAFDAAERAGRLLMEAFMYRHHPQMQRAEELVAGGAIGRPRALRAVFSFAMDLESDNIRLRPELDGGALMDVGCYCVSGLRLFGGEPERFHGEQVLYRGVDVAFHGTMRFASDVIGQFYASFELPLQQELEAIGEEGSLLVTAPWRQDWGGDVLLRRGDEVERVQFEQADAYRVELENLTDAIEGRAEPLLGRDDAVAQARAIDALYRAAAPD